MMLTVSSQRSQSAVLLLSVLLALLAVSHGGNKSPKNQEQPLLEEYNYVTMEWVKFEGSVPTDAVSIKKDGKLYVCRNMQKKCSIGILKGSTCEYEEAENFKTDDPFEVLVNQDNFESLEWKKIQCTAEVEEVRKNAVRICDDQDLFVGINSDKAKSLPAVKSALRKSVEKFYPIKTLRKTKVIKGLETLTGSCKVLTVSYENVKDEELHDEVYDDANVNKSESSLPKQTSDSSEVENPGDTELTHFVKPSMTISQEGRWNITHTVSDTSKLIIKIKLPKTLSTSLDLSHQTINKEKRGFSVKEDKKLGTKTKVKIPPRSKCTVRLTYYRQHMERIPFNAKLTRRFKRGDPKTITVSGRFVANNVLDIKTVVEKCEPLDRNVASAGGSVPKKVIIVKDKQN